MSNEPARHQLQSHLQTSPHSVLRSIPGAEPFEVTLRFTVSNSGNPVACQALIFDLGRSGPAASDLTTQFPADATAYEQPGDSLWSVRASGGKYTVTPSNGASRVIGLHAVILEISSIQVNSASGSVQVTITEVLATQTAKAGKSIFKSEGVDCSLKVLSAAPMRGEQVHLRYQSNFADVCSIMPGGALDQLPLSCEDYVSGPLQGATTFTLTAGSRSYPSYSSSVQQSVDPADPGAGGLLALQIALPGSAAALFPNPRKCEVYCVSTKLQRLDTIRGSLADVGDLTRISSGGFAPNGRTLYLASSEGVIVCDDGDPGQSTTVEFTAPKRVATNGDAKRVYVASSSELIAIDNETKTTCAGPTVPPHYVSAMAGNGRFLYFGGDRRAFLDGTFVWVFDTVSWIVLADKYLDTAGHDVRDLCVSPDGQLLFVSTAAMLYAIEISANWSARPLNSSPGGGLALSPDGKTVYFANSSGGTIDCFDAASGKLTTTRAIGGEPWGVAAEADGSRVYVTDAQTNQVKVVGLRPRQLIDTGCQRGRIA